MINTLPGAAAILNVPLSSAIVPVVVPFIVMEAADTGLPSSSVTLPRRADVWAAALIAHNNVKQQIVSFSTAVMSAVFVFLTIPSIKWVLVVLVVR